MNELDFSLDVREVTEHVSDHAVWLLDSDGRVAGWNESAQRLTGYDADEIVGDHYRELFPTDARASGRPERLLERARAEGQAEDEGWRVRSDGGEIWVREVTAPIREAPDGDGAVLGVAGESERSRQAPLRGYGCFVLDRTDERERERELREEKALTESVLQAQPDIVYAFDVDGNYLEWNDRVPEVTGYSESELRELDPLAFVAPEHRDRIADAIRRILEEDEHVTAEATLLTKDGERIPYEFNSARITDEDGTVLGFTGVGRDVSERNERERELREEKALTESVFAAQPDLLYAYDTDGNLFHWNDRLETITGYDPDELENMAPLEFIAPDHRERIGDAIDRILEAGERVTAEADLLTKDGERIPYEFNSARITDEDGTVLGFTGVGRDISERKARERELERLERLNAIVRAVDETMVAAETRAAIERAIVEEFAAADAYRFAVIGRFDSAGPSERGSLEPRTWAGIDLETEAETESNADEGDGTADVLASFVDPPSDAPGRSALETGTVQRYRNLPEHPIDAWRRDARERGYGAVAVVPIAAGDRSFGVLLIAAAEPRAFADREREVLQEFGGTIGHAINAMTVRRLLYKNEVVELEFESTDRGDACVDLSARADCRLTLDHALPLTDERFAYYVTIAGADPDRIRELAAADPSVSEARCIEVREDDDGTESEWELTIRGSTFGERLAGYGARLRSKVIESGRATIRIEASPDAPIRELVDALRSAYPETTLVSKRTVERSVEPSGDFRNRVESALTDKQRTALEAAYYGGYFEWPTRNSDAGDIADQLGIARQTFHQHLRVAQQKLLAAYFERDS